MCIRDPSPKPNPNPYREEVCGAPYVTLTLSPIHPNPSTLPTSLVVLQENYSMISDEDYSASDEDLPFEPFDINNDGLIIKTGSRCSRDSWKRPEVGWEVAVTIHRFCELNPLQPAKGGTQDDENEPESPSTPYKTQIEPDLAIWLTLGQDDSEQFPLVGGGTHFYLLKYHHCCLLLYCGVYSCCTWMCVLKRGYATCTVVLERIPKLILQGISDTLLIGATRGRFCVSWPIIKTIFPQLVSSAYAAVRSTCVHVVDVLTILHEVTASFKTSCLSSNKYIQCMYSAVVRYSQIYVMHTIVNTQPCLLTCEKNNNCALPHEDT